VEVSVVSGTITSMWLIFLALFCLHGLWSLGFVSCSLPSLGRFLSIKFGKVSSKCNVCPHKQLLGVLDEGLGIGRDECDSLRNFSFQIEELGGGGGRGGWGELR
jgi:hypothetical protein